MRGERSEAGNRVAAGVRCRMAAPAVQDTFVGTTRIPHISVFLFLLRFRFQGIKPQVNQLWVKCIPFGYNKTPNMTNFQINSPA